LYSSEGKKRSAGGFKTTNNEDEKKERGLPANDCGRRKNVKFLPPCSRRKKETYVSQRETDKMRRPLTQEKVRGLIRGKENSILSLQGSDMERAEKIRKHSRRRSTIRDVIIKEFK